MKKTMVVAILAAGALLLTGCGGDTPDRAAVQADLNKVGWSKTLAEFEAISIKSCESAREQGTAYLRPLAAKADTQQVRSLFTITFTYYCDDVLEDWMKVIASKR
jgi:hypothetical protein